MPSVVNRALLCVRWLGSSQPEPQIVSGWHYHQYSGGDRRYSYIGKDEDGTPEFVDYGPKSSR